MIYVIATVEVREGQREAFLREFHRLIPLVRGEPGCVEYGSAVDVPAGLADQVPPRDDVVTVVEKWEGLDALRTHLQGQHMQEYQVRVKDLVARVQLRVLQPA